MAKELIEDYRIGWNFQKNNGGFSIKKKGGSRFNKINIDLPILMVKVHINLKFKKMYSTYESYRLHINECTLL